MAKNTTGHITQIMGAVIDVRFPAGELPNILTALDLQHEGKRLVLEVAHRRLAAWPGSERHRFPHLGAGRARNAGPHHERDRRTD